MNCRDCQPLLSAYVDDAMRVNERAAVDAHLAGCAACRMLAADLATVRTAAASMETLIPPARVWHQLSATVATETRGGFRFGWFGWRPLTAAMAVVIAAGLWQVGTRLQPVGSSHSVSQGASQAAANAPANSGADPEAEYTVAIARLEEVTRADRDVLDQETAGAVNAGLTVIDQAISESRTAVQSEPQSESAQESLSAALRRKVALLQETVALITEMRQGSQVSEINR